MKQAASIHLTLPNVTASITLSTTADDYALVKQMRLMKVDGTTWHCLER
jgi:hypothetical protein